MTSLRGPDGSPSDPDDLVGSSGSAPASADAPDDFLSRARRAAAQIVELTARFPWTSKLPSTEWARLFAAADDRTLLELLPLGLKVFDLMAEEDAPTPDLALQKRNNRIYQEVRASMPKPGRPAGKQDKRRPKYLAIAKECWNEAEGNYARAQTLFVERTRGPKFNITETTAKVRFSEMVKDITKQP